MSPISHIDDLLSRRYSAVCLNADRQVTAAMRAFDRAEVLGRAARERELVRNREGALLRCQLRRARP